jgi:hypothetical protein
MPIAYQIFATNEIKVSQVLARTCCFRAAILEQTNGADGVILGTDRDALRERAPRVTAQPTPDEVATPFFIGKAP